MVRSRVIVESGIQYQVNLNYGEDELDVNTYTSFFRENGLDQP